MKGIAALMLSLSLTGGALVAQGSSVRSLLSKDLAGVPGKELSMITVEYSPGEANPVHTHHAQAMLYVLEGSIEMQLRGGAPVTLTAGQTSMKEGNIDHETRHHWRHWTHRLKARLQAAGARP